MQLCSVNYFVWILTALCNCISETERSSNKRIYSSGKQSSTFYFCIDKGKVLALRPLAISSNVWKHAEANIANIDRLTHSSNDNVTLLFKPSYSTLELHLLHFICFLHCTLNLENGVDTSRYTL